MKYLLSVKLKHLFITMLLVAACCPGFSQCIMLKVDLNDCIIHRSAILKFQSSSTGVPVYVVFPENKRPDSADIDYAGRFTTSKIRMRFNDKWHKQLVCKQSRTCAFGLDKFGTVVFQTPVDKLDSAALQNYLEQNQPSDEEPDGSILAFKDSLQFKFDDQLARLVVSNRLSGKTLYSIKSSTFDLSLIADRLTGIKKEKFLKYGTQVNKGTTSFISRFVSFGVVNDSTILMCLLYHNTPDSISANITDEYAFIEYNLRGKLRNIRLANIPEDIIFYNQNFIFDHSNVYMPFWRLNSNHGSEPDNWNTTQYIARLKVKDEQYVIDSILSQTIPWYYSKRKTYNYLTLTYSVYPYITSYLGNELTNLRAGKTVEIVPSSAFRTNIDFSKSGGEFDQSLEQFHCYGIGLDEKSDELIAIYKYGNTFTLGRYYKDLNKISHCIIDYDFIPGASFIWANIYPEVNLIEMRTKLKDGDFRQYYLPLDLFY